MLDRARKNKYVRICRKPMMAAHSLSRFVSDARQFSDQVVPRTIKRIIFIPVKISSPEQEPSDQSVNRQHNHHCAEFSRILMSVVVSIIFFFLCGTRSFLLLSYPLCLISISNQRLYVVITPSRGTADTAMQSE